MQNIPSLLMFAVPETFRTAASVLAQASARKKTRRRGRPRCDHDLVVRPWFARKTQAHTSLRLSRGSGCARGLRTYVPSESRTSVRGHRSRDATVSGGIPSARSGQENLKDVRNDLQGDAPDPRPMPREPRALRQTHQGELSWAGLLCPFGVENKMLNNMGERTFVVQARFIACQPANPTGRGARTREWKRRIFEFSLTESYFVSFLGRSREDRGVPRAKVARLQRPVLVNSSGLALSGSGCKIQRCWSTFRGSWAPTAHSHVSRPFPHLVW